MAAESASRIPESIQTQAGQQLYLAAMSLPFGYEPSFANEMLFQALYELWVKLGRQPKYSEVEKPICRYSTNPYTQRFGSWRKSLEAFVDYVNAEEMPAPRIESLDSTLLPQRRRSRTINLRLRFRVLQRDRFCCCACGRSPASTLGLVLEVDHMKPWSKGGETEIENLQTLCSKCNQGKSNIYEQEEAK